VNRSHDKFLSKVVCKLGRLISFELVFPSLSNEGKTAEKRFPNRKSAVKTKCSSSLKLFPAPVWYMASVLDFTVCVLYLWKGESFIRL
jgi:hypothetical protein